jgi:acetyl-CoA carboxylase biotin carboxyl carrier protein
MSDIQNPQTSPDREMIESVWAEARDLIRRLEGSTVQRFAVAAGEYKIEIERAGPAPAAPPPPPGDAAAPPLPRGQTRALGPTPLGPAGRGASGVFAFNEQQAADNRIPVLAPLVGTFYSSPKPGAKAFVEVGDSVDAGQPVCIVEAMKMMNEVVAGEAGKVVEIAAADGEWVEFEQVLMYLEPPEA